MTEGRGWRSLALSSLHKSLALDQSAKTSIFRIQYFLPWIVTFLHFTDDFCVVVTITPVFVDKTACLVIADLVEKVVVFFVVVVVFVVLDLLVTVDDVA